MPVNDGSAARQKRTYSSPHTATLLRGGALRKTRKDSCRHERDEERRNSGGERPDKESKEPRKDASRGRGQQRMNAPRHREREGSESDSESSVQGRGARGVAQPEVLVPDVYRERSAADRPRRQSPQVHVTARRGEHSADEEVRETDEKRRANPGLTR